MKKNLLFAASILAVSGFLAACGTEDAGETEPAEETASTPQETVEEVVEEETAEDTPAEDTAEEGTPEEDVTEETDDSTDGAGSEMEEEPAEDTEEVVEEPVNRAATEGTLTVSDEQSYEVYVLPGYELTSEEPGKDSLYLAEDGGVFMRIETFDPATLDFAGAKDSLMQTLTAITSEADMTENTLEGDFVDSAVYETSTGDSKVTGIVLQKENLVVRLTVFDSPDGAATEDFVEMGKTVQPIQ